MNFSTKIVNWYEQNKRSLPWRETSDPYRIWLSEIILQQTRVDQGTAYYHRFLEAFPDINSLAGASEEQVLKHWQGLGYYTRARNLHRAANILLTRHKGIFPQEYKSVLNLPGIGEYTAAAILSIAFGQAYPVVDGNVNRVISRVFGIYEPVDGTVGKKLILEKATSLMDKATPGVYNQAIMEFGALHCTPRNPSCSNCIFKSECRAFQNGDVENLPTRKVKPVQRFRHFYYFLFIFRSNHSTKILINKRGGKDIWKNLYDFPLVEKSRRTPLKEIRESGIHGLELKNKVLKTMGNEYKHILSHQVILARFIRVDCTEEQMAEIRKHLRIENLIPIETRDLVHFPVPRLIEKFLEENQVSGSSGA
jgi:A/G-specific adenine glycosylase